MKPPMITDVIRSMRVRVFALSLLAGLLVPVPAAHAQADQILQASGGTGGGQYVARCPAGEVLTGFDLRTGDDVDAIRPLCVAVRGPADVGPIDPYPSQFGGGGGGPLRIGCPSNAPLVIGMEILAEGVKTVIVNNIHLFCGLAIANQTLPGGPSAVFDGPPAQYSDAIIFATGNSVQHYGTFTDPHDRDFGPQICPKDLVAVGINGRSGIWLDAVGLICGAPPLVVAPAQPANITPGNAGKRPVALGRVKISSPVATKVNSGREIDTAILAQANSPNDPPICVSARTARLRNSPAAPGLERQCATARANASQSSSPGETPPAASVPAADGPPVRAPHDLFVVSMQFFQDGNPVQAVRVGSPVTIECTYIVDVKPGLFFGIQQWQGIVETGGGARQTLEFQGRRDAGQYVANVIWMPTAEGRVPVSCMVNSRFASAEAVPGNNQRNDTVMVLPASPPIK
jgi:hypothetical protein